MITQKYLRSSLVAACFLITSGLVVAQSSDQKEPRERKGPPPQAIEACSGLNEGDACKFTGRRGEASGICSIPPNDDSTLACKPQRSKSKD